MVNMELSLFSNSSSAIRYPTARKMSLEKSKSLEAGLHSIIGTETTTKDADEEKKVSACTKFKMIFGNITVEPIMAFYILPSVMASITTQNLSLEKACRVNLAYGDEICDALSTRNSSAYPGYKTDEETVQKLAANMAIVKNIIQSLLPSLLLLFLGSWSDRHQRRKPCILSPVVGEIVACFGFITCTYFFYELPMEVNTLVEAIPPAITGGWFCMFMGVFSFVSGISSEKQRTLRIGAVNMFVNVSICVGISLSGILYQKIGFYGVYSLSLAMYFTALFYGMFFVKEVNEYDTYKQINDGKQEEDTKKVKKNALKDFFDVKHAMDTFRVAFKSGEHNRRMRICVIMVLVMIIIGPMHGEMNVAYFFVRYKFGWDAIDYSLFSTFQFVTHTLGTIFSLVFFTKFLKLDDSVLGMISCTSKILGSLIYAYSPTPLIFYAGAIVEILNGTSFIAMRSIVSKLVPSEEIGKINSLFGVAEAVIPLIYGPLYSKIYSKTMDKFPGAFYLAGGGLTVPAVFIFFWLYLQKKKDLKEAAKNKQQEETLLDKNKEKAHREYRRMSSMTV